MCSFWKLVTNSFRPAVAVAIFGVDAHARLGLTSLVERGPGGFGGVLECTVPLVEEEKVGVHVVGDVEVDPAVAIEVGGDDPKSVAVGTADARLLGHVGESPVAVVAVEEMLDGSDVPRRTEDGHPIAAAVMGVAGIDPIAVVGDVDVQVAVVVVVEHRPPEDQLGLSMPADG